MTAADVIVSALREDEPQRVRQERTEDPGFRRAWAKQRVHNPTGPPPTALARSLSGAAGTYVDPVLREGRLACFVFDQLHPGSMKVTWSPPEESGMLFVVENDSSLRIILDARRANRYFRRPLVGLMFTAEGLSHVELNLCMKYLTSVACGKNVDSNAKKQPSDFASARSPLDHAETLNGNDDGDRLEL